MKRTRRRIDSALKAEIALEALRGQTPVSELATRYEVHPNKIYAWKKQLENYAVTLFDRRPREIAELEAKFNRMMASIKPNVHRT